MALTGPEGETHSYIAPQDRERVGRLLARHGQLTGEPLPDRGHWVGPGTPNGRDGQPAPTAAEDWAHKNGLPLDPPESTLPMLARWSGDARIVAKGAIQQLLEQQPMVRAQRTILLEAIHVLEAFK